RRKAGPRKRLAPEDSSCRLGSQMLFPKIPSLSNPLPRRVSSYSLAGVMTACLNLSRRMTEMNQQTDYIVVGSGIAGLRAAIDLADAGRVTIFTKSQITESNSMYAQGGIAAAFGSDDRTDNQCQDTIAAGAGLCDADGVRVLVDEGPAEIERLLGWGADFEKENNRLSLSREGGHGVARIVHGNGGLTGKVVVDTLL